MENLPQGEFSSCGNPSPPSRNTPGRGALGNPTGRFEPIEVVYDSHDIDGDDWPEWIHEKPLKTQFFKDYSRSIITTNDSPDVGFSASVNPYRGCEHGCIYCYARPTHEYLGLSAGLDFESKIFVKTDAPVLLREALSAKSWEPKPVIFSGVTDCYQPAERVFKLTRQCLAVMAEFRNPVGIITKNALVTRDIDILSELAQAQAAQVYVSITTLDPKLARTMEPRTATPARRLDAVKQLSAAGIPVSVMMGPIVPGLTDHEIDAILHSAAKAGALTACYTMLRLPYGVKHLFEEWLSAHFPQRKNKVLNRIRDVRHGGLNDNQFGRRMRGEGAYADYIAHMFTLARKRYGLNQHSPPLSTEAFRRLGGEQLRLF